MYYNYIYYFRLHSPNTYAIKQTKKKDNWFTDTNCIRILTITSLLFTI